MSDITGVNPKKWPKGISESIPAFFWFLYENGRAVGARFLKARGFTSPSIHANFSLYLRAQHKIVNSRSYGPVG
jgi:hypothetical protein